MLQRLLTLSNRRLKYYYCAEWLNLTTNDINCSGSKNRNDSRPINSKIVNSENSSNFDF